MSVEELAQAFRDTEKEYQFAWASGDQDRIKAAIRARSKAWKEYSQLKKKEFKS